MSSAKRDPAQFAFRKPKKPGYPSRSNDYSGDAILKLFEVQRELWTAGLDAHVKDKVKKAVRPLSRGFGCGADVGPRSARNNASSPR